MEAGFTISCLSTGSVVCQRSSVDHVCYRPKVDHVSRLLHELKISFSPVTLDLIEEGEAVNKHVWSYV